MVGEWLFPCLHEDFRGYDFADGELDWPLPDFDHRVIVGNELSDGVGSLIDADYSGLPFYSFILNERVGVSEGVVSGMIMEEQVSLGTHGIDDGSSKKGYLVATDIGVVIYS